MDIKQSRKRKLENDTYNTRSKKRKIEEEKEEKEEKEEEKEEENLTEIKSNCDTYVHIVDDKKGLAIECLLVLDQIHDFGEKANRNMLYQEGDHEQFYLKLCTNLINYHWVQIKKRYYFLKETDLYKYLFNSVSIKDILNVRSYKYKVCSKIIEHFKDINEITLLPEDLNGWRSYYAVDIVKNFFAEIDTNNIFIDCTKSKYNLYPILHLITDTAFNPNDNVKLNIIKTFASIYDPATSNSIETHLNKINEIKKTHCVNVVHSYSSDITQRYIVKTKSHTIVDFEFTADKNYIKYDINTTPDEYMISGGGGYNQKILKKIYKTCKEQFGYYQVSQQEFLNDPFNNIKQIRNHFQRNNINITPINLDIVRIRAKIHKFLDQDTFYWCDNDKPFRNVSVRNVSEYVLKNKHKSHILNTFAFKTIGDFSQIIECHKQNGLFLTVDDIGANISSLINPTLFEKEEHVLSALVYYGKANLPNLIRKLK